MPRLHLIHVAQIQVAPTCIHLYRLLPCTCKVSCIGDKIVVTATCIWCIRGLRSARRGPSGETLYFLTAGSLRFLELVIILTCVSITAHVIDIGCPSVRPTVRLSVRPSHAGIVSKRLNLSSNCLHCLVAP